MSIRLITKKLKTHIINQIFFDKNITEIHFYHNLIAIKKDKNLEESNILINNKRLVGGKNLIGLRKFIKSSKYLLLNLIAKMRIFVKDLF